MAAQLLHGTYSYRLAASVSLIHNSNPIRRAHPDFTENLLALGGWVRWVD
jgi:hypothetical protein